MTSFCPTDSLPLTYPYEHRYTNFTFEHSFSDVSNLFVELNLLSSKYSESLLNAASLCHNTLVLLLSAFKSCQKNHSKQIHGPVPNQDYSGHITWFRTFSILFFFFFFNLKEAHLGIFFRLFLSISPFLF